MTRHAKPLASHWLLLYSLYTFYLGCLWEKVYNVTGTQNWKEKSTHRNPNLAIILIKLIR